LTYTFHPYKKSKTPGEFFQRHALSRAVGSKKRPGKYGNYSATYDGYTYMSRKEALYAAELDTLKKAYMPKDRVVKVERQVNVDLVVNGKTVCRIIPDFRVTFADGHVEWHEIKSYGTMTPVYRVKKKLFEALFPKEIYRVIL
jgi:hypothetical protein